MKILLVSDAANFNKEQLKVAAFFTKQANAELTAIFLEMAEVNFRSSLKKVKHIIF